MLVGIWVLDISDNGPVLLNMPANSSIEWGSREAGRLVPTHCQLALWFWRTAPPLGLGLLSSATQIASRAMERF